MDKQSMAMHQPNYIPWLGYFSKMKQCDVFVYLDVVQFPRGQSFSPRNRIKTPNGPVFLTIPLRIPGGNDGKALYTEVEFADDKWKRKHLKTLELSYKRSPHFAEVYALFEVQLMQHDSFVELSIGLLEAIAEYLAITSRRVRLSGVLQDFGQKTDLIIDLCKALDVQVYLSGTGGGKEYNDDTKMHREDVELRYSVFDHPQYPQLWGDFVSHLSILDALFMCGRETSELL